MIPSFTEADQAEACFRHLAIVMGQAPRTEAEKIRDAIVYRLDQLGLFDRLTADQETRVAWELLGTIEAELKKGDDLPALAPGDDENGPRDGQGD